MKRHTYIIPTLLCFGLVSCSLEEPETANTDSRLIPITYSVTTNQVTRTLSEYQNGIDINKITVSAWVRENESTIPDFAKNQTANSQYFLNDVIIRKDGEGSFTYANNTRYWPNNGEILDFFAFVDDDKFTEDVKFSFNCDGLPGIAGIPQLANMPDLLFSYLPNQKLNGKKEGQHNASLKFYHALAKVTINSNIDNAEITGITLNHAVCKGTFIMPHRTGEGDVSASWINLETSEVQTIQISSNTETEDVTTTGHSSTKSDTLSFFVIPNDYTADNSGMSLEIRMKILNGTETEEITAVITGVNWEIGSENTYNITKKGNSSSSSSPLFLSISV